MKRHRLLFFILTIVLFQQNLSAQKYNSAKKVYTTTENTKFKAPVIDGVIDDESWGLVPWGTDFIENEPDENTAPSFQTRFKIQI